MKTFWKSLYIYSAIMAALAVGLMINKIWGREIGYNTAIIPSFAEQEPQAAILEEKIKKLPETEVLFPATLSLVVPFTTQAPRANWDALHEEMCEEASLIMAHAYYDDLASATLTPVFVENEISKLVVWQKKNFGYFNDTDSMETARIAEEFYSLKTKLIENFTVEDVKEELVQGRLVIVPLDGRLLGNPNYKAPGPDYHMMVIKGYNETQFITNDPGTRKGNGYVYNFDTFLNAAGDWSHTADAVDPNNKIALVVWK